MTETDLADFSLAAVPDGKSTMRLRLLYFRDGTRLGVPLAVIKGAAPGPCVCILATQHGDEWNGAYIIHHLYSQLSLEGFCGTLVLLPIANPPAFNEKSRVSRIDGVDMNRVYQFFKGHRPTEQLAQHLFDAVFSRMDYVIDLHSGGPGEYLPNAGCLRSRVSLAESFGLGHIITAEDSAREEFIKHSGGLIPACEREGVAGFVLEIGRGRAIQRDYARQTVDGLINFLHTVGSLEGAPEPTEPHSIYTDKVAVKSPIPGIFDAGVSLGDTVRDGQLIGKVTALLAKESFEAFAPRAGTVIYVRREEMVAEGESLYHIAWG